MQAVLFTVSSSLDGSHVRITQPLSSVQFREQSVITHHDKTIQGRQQIRKNQILYYWTFIYLLSLIESLEF